MICTSPDVPSDVLGRRRERGRRRLPQRHARIAIGVRVSCSLLTNGEHLNLDSWPSSPNPFSLSGEKPSPCCPSPILGEGQQGEGDPNEMLPTNVPHNCGKPSSTTLADPVRIDERGDLWTSAIAINPSFEFPNCLDPGFRFLTYFIS